MDAREQCAVLTECGASSTRAVLLYGRPPRNVRHASILRGASDALSLLLLEPARPDVYLAGDRQASAKVTLRRSGGELVNSRKESLATNP
jgi:hypothetical protein